MPTFLVNAALAGWIKWASYETPAITITVFLGCAIVYLVSTSGTWIRHLVAPAAVDEQHAMVTSPVAWDAPCAVCTLGLLRQMWVQATHRPRCDLHVTML